MSSSAATVPQKHAVAVLAPVHLFAKAPDRHAVLMVGLIIQQAVRRNVDQAVASAQILVIVWRRRLQSEQSVATPVGDHRLDERPMGDRQHVMIAVVQCAPVISHDPCPDLFRISPQHGSQAVALNLVGQGDAVPEDFFETCPVDLVGLRVGRRRGAPGLQRRQIPNYRRQLTRVARAESWGPTRPEKLLRQAAQSAENPRSRRARFPALVAVAILGLNLGTEMSAGLGVGGAILAMALLRAMHPPRAAVALATVLSFSDIAGLSYGFVLSPVMLDTALLVGLAVLYNRLTGRKYPFRQPSPAGQHATTDASPERRLGLSADDLAAVLDRFNLSANIGAENFGRVLAAAEAEAARRYFDDMTCSDVMSRDLVCVTEETRLGRVADLFRMHGFKTLPVIDNDGRIIGIVTSSDLLAVLARRTILAGLIPRAA